MKKLSPSTKRALWIGGSAAAAVAVVGGAVLLTHKSAQAATPPSGGGAPPGPPGGTTTTTTTSSSPGSGYTKGTLSPGGGYKKAIPALPVSGPYTELSAPLVMQPYETYLLSLAAIPGMTLAQAAANMQKNGLNVIASYDAFSAPGDWPTDPGINWLFVVQYGGVKPSNPTLFKPLPPYKLPALIGTRLWTTGGATA